MPAEGGFMNIKKQVSTKKLTNDEIMCIAKEYAYNNARQDFKIFLNEDNISYIPKTEDIEKIIERYLTYLDDIQRESWKDIMRMSYYEILKKGGTYVI